MKLRKPHQLPQYVPDSYVQALIAAAERGLRCQSEWQKVRNTAAITIMAYAGLRKTEVLTRPDNLEGLARLNARWMQRLWAIS